MIESRDDRAESSTGSRAGTRPRRDTVRRRRQILDAAKEVFTEQGFEGARTKDIAAAAGITQTVMYRYFASKDELFTAAIVEPLDGHFERLFSQGVEEITLADTDVEREAAILRFARSWLETLDEIAPLLGAALFSDRAAGAQFYHERVYPILLRAIERIRTTLRGWGRDDIDPEVLVLGIFGTHFTIALDRHFRGAKADIDELVPKIADQIIYGVVRRPVRADG
jgi:AcrR family transcriptional regulator